VRKEANSTVLLLGIVWHLGTAFYIGVEFLLNSDSTGISLVFPTSGESSTSAKPRPLPLGRNTAKIGDITTLITERNFALSAYRLPLSSKLS